MRGTSNAAHHMGKHFKGLAYAKRAEMWEQVGSVEVTDALEAAVASGCSCIANHCPALLDERRPKRRPRIVKRFNPNSDSQQTDAQADGEKGDESGG